jgi:hypothetical protein
MPNHIKPKPKSKGAVWDASPLISKPSKKKSILSALLFVLLWIVLTIVIVNLAGAEGQSTTKQSVLIEGSAGVPTSVTVLNEYDVEMTASVEKSPCLKCLDNLYITDCQSIGFCLDVVVY